jgi:hypothetical protein
MNKGPRNTNCPLCGAQLGVTIDGQWVPMPLDEYRDHIAMRLRATRPLPHACVACGATLSDASYASAAE